MILDRGPLQVKRDNDEMEGDEEAKRGDMSEVHTLLTATINLRLTHPLSTANTSNINNTLLYCSTDPRTGMVICWLRP